MAQGVFMTEWNVFKHKKQTTKLKSEGKHLKAETLEKGFFKIKHSCYFLCFSILFFNLPPRGGSEQQQEISREEMKEGKMQL